jgi:hypothetical protein
MVALNTKVEAGSLHDVKGEVRAYVLEESLRKNK